MIMWQVFPKASHYPLLHLVILLMTFKLIICFEFTHTSISSLGSTVSLAHSDVSSIVYFFCLWMWASLSCSHIEKGSLPCVSVSVHFALSSHKARELILFLFIIIAHDELPKMHIEWSEYTHFELWICISINISS